MNNKHPKLSIIVPVYNTEKYLEECLEKLTNASFKDIEIICVNDGSTDNSELILKKYKTKDGRIKLLNQENKGLGSARNRGLEAACGEYITFVDSDDYIDIFAYEKLLENIKDADIACFGVEIFGDVSPFIKRMDEKYYKIRYKGRHKLNDKLKINTNASVCNKIFKRNLIEKYKIKFPEKLHYEDFFFYWAYIIRAKNAYFTNEPFYKYRRHKGSIMSKTFSGKGFPKEHLHIANRLYNYLVEHKIFKGNQKLFIKLFSICFLFAYNNSTNAQKQDVLETANKYANKFFNSRNTHSGLIENLKKKNYNKILDQEHKFKKIIRTIFSVANSPKGEHKVITVLGLKLKFARKGIK